VIYLAMLGKLNLNKFMIIKKQFKIFEFLLKISIFLLVFFSSSCQKNFNDSVEARCENGNFFLLKSMSIDDVKTSIAKAIQEKQEYDFNINYTVISNGKESMMIENFKPEDFNKCSLRTVNYKHSYKNFIRR